MPQNGTSDAVQKPGYEYGSFRSLIKQQVPETVRIEHMPVLADSERSVFDNEISWNIEIMI